MIFVTKPFLPPREEYERYVNGIWQRNWLTNHGPLVNELELQLKDYLQLDHLLYLNNGTIALQIALKALGLKGEVITTPFSYVATTSAIAWEGLKPVFVDIDPQTANIDPNKIEAAITPRTSAILATHVYGNPCDIDAIKTIADRHRLKVIYDGAHCFGTKYKGRSVFEYGDISTTSFHATKLFHTVEGGAVFTTDPDLLKKMALLRNFGHEGPNDFGDIGINGKNSEFHAAMGLANLKYIGEILESRKAQWLRYRDLLAGFQARTIRITEGAEYNYAYFPLIFSGEEELLKYLDMLGKGQVFPRRYFYPSLNRLPYVKQVEAPVSEQISSSVCCLPMYYDLSPEIQQMIARFLLRMQNN